ncbi:L,D-transpeptidase family protein [Heliophilum fasciatum]|uniref:Putative peptidoglycan binding protein n=1 Tax=Heliophilum fasciatum TaxID=35700 RepID=A0A4R2REN4_9FIRM|nr:L,D-transpeptidase family protein [Heliophilum fasciatum]MCW2279165.1 hypothetical protein [Heliophilum fasciatum]TCP61024.1 putative peptidoglycan binding protein [Heliophilum fasciatum]
MFWIINLRKIRYGIVMVASLIVLVVVLTGIYYWHNLSHDRVMLLPAQSQSTIRLSINLPKHRLTLFIDNQRYKEYPIAIGKKQTPSPVGDWTIVDKQKHWGGGLGTRWLGLNVPWGTYGIHGTNKPWSIGQSLSLGCFRMNNQQVEELYEWVPVGTIVEVTGQDSPRFTRSSYKIGDIHQEIVYIQRQLRKLGFLSGLADGRFGPATQEAVEAFQLSQNLPVDGIVTESLRRHLWQNVESFN